MAAGKFSLADRLGAKSMPCRVPGCTRTWLQLSSKTLSLGPTPESDQATEGMCDPCREKSRHVRDQERRCDRPGCSSTWTWTAQAQLEAFAGDLPAPKTLCAACKALLDSLEDKEIACAVPGCSRKAKLTKQQQLLQQGQPEGAKPAEPARADGVTIDGIFCDPCTQIARKLRDRQMNCGINSCSRKWVWKADEQIQAFAQGKPNEAPRRMCEVCRASFGKLADRDVRCRTSGCKQTWVWSRYDQLDACVADKQPPKAPSRMCQRCFDLWSTLKDVERPCRRSTCKGTWMDKRGAQLARAVRGKTGDPYPRLCTNCEKELGELEDREIPCRTENCSGTFTWTKEQQLAAGVRPKFKDEEANAPTAIAAEGSAEAALPAIDGTAAPTAEAVAKPTREEKGKRKKKRRREIQPPERRCPACAEFLANKKTQEIPCSQCTTPIFWPPESQLQTHLGHWSAPTLCGACKLAQVQAAREAAREALRHPTLPAPEAQSATEAEKPAPTT